VPFVPQPARTYLSAAQVADPLSPNDTVAPLRREALDVLGQAYASRARLGAGALACVLGLAAALLGASAVDRWSASDGSAVWLGGGAALLSLCAAVLGASVVHAGSVLSRAVAAWLATPTRSARTRDAARPHRAIVTRAALGSAATVVALGLLGLLLRELLGPGPGAAGAALTTTPAAAKTAVVTDLRNVVGLAAAVLVSGTAAISLLSGANRIHAAAWQPAPAPPRPWDNGDGPAANRQNGTMLLVPAPARNFLDPADYRRDWTTYGSMMIRRQVAMRTLLPGYADLGRLALGTLAWAVGLVGATLLRAGAGAETALGLAGTPAALVGGLLLAVGASVGLVVIVAGSRLARGLVLWALMPQLVRADGSRRAAGSTVTTSPTRAAEDPIASLAPRLLAAVVAAAVAVVWSVDVVRDGIVVLAPYSTSSDLGVLLASAIGAGASWTAAVATWLGWRRVRGALGGRMAPAQEAAALRELNGGAVPVRWGPAPAGTASAAAPSTHGLGTGADPVAPSAGEARPTLRPATAPTAVVASGPTAPPGTGPLSPVTPPDAGAGRPAGPSPSRPHRSEVAQVRVGGRLLEPGTTLVGRSPAARPGEPVDRTLAVDDPTMSKTHLAVRVTPGGVWVTDRASTNGTTVVTGNGEQRLVPWQETRVPPGARVRAGATVIARGSAEPEQTDVESTVLRGSND